MIQSQETVKFEAILEHILNLIEFKIINISAFGWGVVFWQTTRKISGK